MHGDLASKRPRKKAVYHAEKRVIAADAPPAVAAKQAFYYGLAGLLSLPLIILIAFVVKSEVLWVLLGIVWLIAVLYMIVGAFRGKYELDAIKRGRSAPRGRILALVGLLAGATALAVNLVIIIIVIWPKGPSITTTGGPFGSPQATFSTYFKALNENNFDDYLKCLASSRRFDEDTNGDGVADSTSEERRQGLLESFKKLRKRWRKFDASIAAGSAVEGEGDIVTLVVSLKHKRTGEYEREAEFRMKKEPDGWKILSKDPLG